MAVEVHTDLVDAQSLRTRVLKSFFLYRISAICGEVTSLFLPVVRSVVRSSHLYRDVDFSAGQLGGHHKYQRLLPQELSASATTSRVQTVV